MEHWPETSTNQETDEGARGSDAARQSNCHRVARTHGPSRTDEKSTKNLRPTTCEPALGSAGKKVLFAECEPIRAFARHVETSVELPSLAGHRLPFSNATLELHGLFVGQPPHGSANACPDAISHSTCSNEAKATFTRSITTYRFDNPPVTSFISNWRACPFICCNSSIAIHNPAITNALPICTQLFGKSFPTFPHRADIQTSTH